jgi:alkylation response protein AidB-like acyl-CoA dehydrogenase
VITFLSAAQESQLAEFRAFAGEYVLPAADKLRSQGVNLQDFIGEFVKRGFLSLCAPKEFGGKGGTFLESVLLLEEIGRCEAGLGLTLGNHIACRQVVQRLGVDNAKSEHLPALCNGSAIGTLALSEATAGTDVAAVQTTVSGGKLNGAKTAVVSGDVATTFVVLAKEEGTPALVIFSAKDRKGIKVVHTHKLMGLQSAHVADLEFADVPVSPDCVVARGQQAIDATFWAMCTAKLMLSACAVGMLDVAAESSVAHANSRQQFGAPIGTFQGVQWKLADMGLDSACSRLQVLRAAWSFDQDPESFLCNAAMANVLATRAARLHCGEAIQILGAQGIMAGHPLSTSYDDAKVMEIAGGTSELQKMLITRQLHI